MKKMLTAITLVACTVSVSSATALYTKCVQCHGANGEKVALGKSKIIKDMSKADFTAAMKGYQDGSYGGAMKAVMKPQAAGLSEADIQEIADFIIK